MQQRQQLQWKGPPVPRAKPIPTEQWEKHKEELCRLYQSMKLDDLMVMMRVRYGFTPSHRQYIFQFEKWAVQKYKTAGNDLMHAEYPSGPSQHPSEIVPDQAIASHNTPQMSVNQRCPTKRQQSQQSLRTKPEVPPKKRQKLEAFMSLRDPYANLGLAFDTPSASLSIPQGLMPPDTRASSTGHILQNNVDEVYKVGTCMPFTPSLQGDKNSQTSSIETSIANKFQPYFESSNSTEGDEFVRWTNQGHADVQMSQGERRLDSSRPIDTFTPDEIHDMKRAADFLFSLTFDRDAFTLYVLMFKRLKDFPNTSECVMSTALLACARSATTSAQAEIARNLLEQKLYDSGGSRRDAENFSLRILLAATYIRRGDYNMANFYTQTAIWSDFDYDKLLTYLPQENRSLDIITYHNLTHSLVIFQENAKRERTFGCVPKGNLISDKMGLQKQLLHRKPGPFEFEHGFMQNPCLRSCLRWCITELQHITTIVTGSWKNLQSNEKYWSWVERVATYCCLWERWQSSPTRYAKPGLWIWANQAENLMGISAAELLKTVCSMISIASPPRVDKSDWDLVHRTRMGARSLSRQRDEELARQFLDMFSWRNFVGPVSAERKAFRDVVRTYAREFIEKSLVVTLPEVCPSKQKPAGENGQPSHTPLGSEVFRRSLSMVAATLLPTLASSLHSSDDRDLYSLRMLRDRIRTNVRSAIQDVVVSVPSNVFRRSDLSLPSMSLLSQAMASQLTLAEQHLQQAGMTALETLATMSSNVRERVVGSGGRLLGNGAGVGMYEELMVDGYDEY